MVSERTLIMTTQHNANITPAIEPVWPLPKLDGHAPVLLVHDEYDPGVELAYERRDEIEGPMVRSTKTFGPIWTS